MFLNSLVMGIPIPNRDTYLAGFCIAAVLYWALSAWLNRSATPSNQTTAEPPTSTLTPDIEQVARDRFQHTEPKSDTEAVRVSTEEVAEPRLELDPPKEPSLCEPWWRAWVWACLPPCCATLGLMAGAATIYFAVRTSLVWDEAGIAV